MSHIPAKFVANSYEKQYLRKHWKWFQLLFFDKHMGFMLSGAHQIHEIISEILKVAFQGVQKVEIGTEKNWNNGIKGEEELLPPPHRAIFLRHKTIENCNGGDSRSSRVGPGEKPECLAWFFFPPENAIIFGNVPKKMTQWCFDNYFE